MIKPTIKLIDLVAKALFPTRLLNKQKLVDTYSHPPAACKSEQAAAASLGYTQLSWDNLSGKEQQPWSLSKSWALMTVNEKKAARVLGYTQISWDSVSGPQPASMYKTWAKLTTCKKSEDFSIPKFHSLNLAYLSSLLWLRQ